MVNGVAFQGTRQTDLVTQGALSFARLPWANFRGPFGGENVARSGDRRQREIHSEPFRVISSRLTV